MQKNKINTLPKLSIIIPNYNYGNFIEETICSVINQNYENLEIIVIDGGSTDNSVDIIKKYQQKITYWISEKDEGQADAINKGLQVATGDYVAYLNSDDTYLPDAFNEIFLDKKSCDKEFIYGDVIIGNELKNSKPNYSKRNKLDLVSLIQFYFSASYIIPSQSVFIKRSFLLKNNLNFLNANLHYCMDLDWYCRISICKPTIYKYKKIHSFFRVNANTKTKSQSSKMKNEALKVAFLYLEKLRIEDKNLFFKMRFLDKVLCKIFYLKFKPSMFYLLNIILKTNFWAFTDKRFIGLLKNKILFK